VRSFSIQTFGCRANQAEAFLWSDELQKKGLRYEKDPSLSDLVLVNTCTVTRKADSDVRKFIRRIAGCRPDARIIVTGCYVQRAPEEFKNIPQVWRIYTNQKKKELIPDLLTCIRPQGAVSAFPFRSRALVKIQDGCNFRCTFCIVPRVRGMSVSLEKEKILAQIRKFIDHGFREVGLTGIHICSYGQDFQSPSSLLELIEEIENLEGLDRLRLSSLDPRFLSFSLLEHITHSEKICPHFHLSLQAGSDKILRLMGRKTAVADYEQILACLRRHSPQASLGADIIVGFPGEGNKEFEQTYRFLEKSPLTYFHVFSYSPRPWTEAASWPQVEVKVKKERASLLRRLGQKKNWDFRRQFVGKKCEAIVINKNEEGARVLTSNYIKVSVSSCSPEAREKIRVRITKAEEMGTQGKILSQRNSIP